MVWPNSDQPEWCCVSLCTCDCDLIMAFTESFTVCFTTAGLGKVKVEDQEIQTEVVETVDQKIQAEVVETVDQEIQAEVVETVDQEIQAEDTAQGV